jgi:nucleoside-diphosphate-sugar epimerase
VCRLERLLRESRFESLTYLSTLGVYRRADAPAREDDPLTLRTALESSRDYVSVYDVAECLVDIATVGRHRVYNVASGRNVSNGQLAARLMGLTGCRVTVTPGAPRVSYPRMDTERVRQELGLEASDLLEDIPGLLDVYRDAVG